MQRKIIDCREMLSENNCTLTIAGTEAEVMETAAAHAIARHGHLDGPELRAGLRASLCDAEPTPA